MVSLDDTIKAAILAAAQAHAFERVSAAADACERLGELSTGRWRSAARDLARLEEDLERALDQTADELDRRARELGIEKDSLWSIGEAASLLDLFRADALDELEEGSPGARLLASDLLLGAAFVEDVDSPDRGTTTLFSWADPLTPVAWPWEATWVSPEGDEDVEFEDLDLSPTGDLDASGSTIRAVGEILEVDESEARDALAAAAAAVTRASILAAAGALEEDDDDSSNNGHHRT